MPHNIKEFAEGLDVTEDDVLLYLSLREAAHQRLFAHVPWLRQHLISSVEDFGRGVTIDISGIEQAMGQLDPSNMEAIQEALQGGLFEPQQTPEQKAALVRLETTLALVEGWVDEVVGQATAERMPAATKMQEAIRRRRAAGGPAEETFAALVGLELRPRRLRDASTLWGSLRSRQGQEARDAVWAHPDLLPTAADLDDPLGFREDLPEVAELTDEDFDKAIGELLDRESGQSHDDTRATRTTRPSDPVRRRGRRTHPLAGTHRRAGARPRGVRDAPAGAPRRPVALVLPRPPHRRCPGAQPRPHPRAAQPAPQGAALVPLRRPPRGRRHPGRRRPARGHRGVRARRACSSTPSRCTSPPIRSSSATRAGRCATSTYGSWPAPATDVEPVVSEESLDVRWWPVDDLPTDEPDMLELVELALARA